MIQDQEQLNKIKKLTKQPFLAHCFSLVICRFKRKDKWLCVKEINNKGWWVPGGMVEPAESFVSAAQRQTLDEAGVNIEVKGILRFEHKISGHQMIRIRIIFYAEAESLQTKQMTDKKSECANWFTIPEILALSRSDPGLRGPELVYWPVYLQNGGWIYPLDLLANESNLNLLENIKLSNLDNLKDNEFKAFKLKNYNKEILKDFEENNNQDIETYRFDEKEKLRTKFEKRDKIKKRNKSTSKVKHVNKLIKNDFELYDENPDREEIEKSSVDELFLQGLEKIDFITLKKAILYGANVNVFLNKKKWTPLYYAAKFQNEELVRILLISGSKPEIVSDSGKNCFHIAAQTSERILIMLLLGIFDYKIPLKIKILNLADKNGNTPLHYASLAIKEGIFKNENVFHMLVENGADPKLNDLYNKNPLEILMGKEN